jgi:hypothetical protein
MLQHRINETIFSLQQITIGLFSETSLQFKEILIFITIALITLILYYKFETK